MSTLGRDAQAALTARLAEAGCVAADDEARELAAAAGADEERLAALAARRETGEPLAWITGRAAFGDVVVGVDQGVYVPRWQSLELARRAARCLGARGVAVDAGTGSGAVAASIQRARPAARIVATDNDWRAVACARANGVDARLGDLLAPVAAALEGRVDVVVAVVPYVPTDALGLLPRDTLRFEDPAHYDGGRDGTDVLRRLAAVAWPVLRPGGALVVELGGSQDRVLAPELTRLGYRDIETWADEDSELRGLQAVRP